MHRLLTGPLKVEKLQIEIADLSPTLRGLKLVQFSDFHFDGLRLSEKLLQAAIAASNAVAPDFVLITGDLVTDDPAAIHNLVPWLTQLQSRYGIYTALGNHDNCYRRSRPEITSALEAAGIHVLWNEIAYPLGEDLVIVGLADFWSPDFRPASVMAQLNAQKPCIVLSHNPDTAAKLQQWRVDLQLSGHTHGGQVTLPGIGNATQHIAAIYKKLPKRLKRLVPWVKSFIHTVDRWEWAEGLHAVGNNLLYVNRGLGTYLPGRLFCPPEVTIITLLPKK